MKIEIGLLLTAMLCAVQLQGVSLRNGDMETQGHWASWVPTGSKSVISYVTEGVHGGKMAMKLDATAAQRTNIFQSNLASFEIGKSYRISGYIKADKAEKVKVQIRRIAPPYLYFASETFEVGPEWKPFAIECTIGEKFVAKEFCFMIDLNGGTNYYFDDFTVEEIEKPATGGEAE